MEDENELIALRRKKLETLRAKGIEPFGTGFDVSGSIAEVREQFKEGETRHVGGRIRKNGVGYRTSKRVTGSVILSFLPTNVRARCLKNESPSFAKPGASSRNAASLKWRRQSYTRWLEAQRPNHSKHVTTHLASIFICALRWNFI